MPTSPGSAFRMRLASKALSRREERIADAGDKRLARAIGRVLARSAGVKPPEVHWRLEQPPTFDNQFGTLVLEGEAARVRIEKTVPGDWRRPRIETSLDRELTPVGLDEVG